MATGPLQKHEVHWMSGVCGLPLLEWTDPKSVESRRTNFGKFFALPQLNGKRIPQPFCENMWSLCSFLSAANVIWFLYVLISNKWKYGSMKKIWNLSLPRPLKYGSIEHHRGNSAAMEEVHSLLPMSGRWKSSCEWRRWWDLSPSQSGQCQCLRIGIFCHLMKPSNHPDSLQAPVVQRPRQQQSPEATAWQDSQSSVWCMPANIVGKQNAQKWLIQINQSSTNFPSSFFFSNSWNTSWNLCMAACGWPSSLNMLLLFLNWSAVTNWGSRQKSVTRNSNALSAKADLLSTCCRQSEK